MGAKVGPPWTQDAGNALPMNFSMFKMDLQQKKPATSATGREGFGYIPQGMPMPSI